MNEATPHPVSHALTAHSEAVMTLLETLNASLEEVARRMYAATLCWWLGLDEMHCEHDSPGGQELATSSGYSAAWERVDDVCRALAFGARGDSFDGRDPGWGAEVALTAWDPR